MCCDVQRAIFAIEYPYPNVSAVIAQDIIGHESTVTGYAFSSHSES